MKRWDSWGKAIPRAPLYVVLKVGQPSALVLLPFFFKASAFSSYSFSLSVIKDSTGSNLSSVSSFVG